MTELLIIKPSSLGDIVQGLQVATSLKAQRPDLRMNGLDAESKCSAAEGGAILSL